MDSDTQVMLTRLESIDVMLTRLESSHYARYISHSDSQAVIAAQCSPDVWRAMTVDDLQAHTPKNKTLNP